MTSITVIPKTEKEPQEFIAMFYGANNRYLKQTKIMATNRFQALAQLDNDGLIPFLCERLFLSNSNAKRCLDVKI
jgi:hypothetical protein